MAWLLRDGEVLASVEVASSLAARSRGLLGKKGYEGALLLRHTRSVHTIGMRFAIDVAFLTGISSVLSVRHAAAGPHRSPAPRADGACSRPRPAPSSAGARRGRPARDQRGDRLPASWSSSRRRSATSAICRRVQRRRCRRWTSCAARTPVTPARCSLALGLRASRLVSLHAHNERERIAEVLELLGARCPGRARQRRRHAGGLRSRASRSSRRRSPRVTG